MSIIVKGMEMPKKCKQCWFFGTDSARVGYCYLLKGELPLPDGVPQDCPLIEVPPERGGMRTMKEGWVCPKCGKVLAPFIPSCDCYRQNKNEQTIQPRIIEVPHTHPRMWDQVTGIKET